MAYAIKCKKSDDAYKVVWLVSDYIGQSRFKVGDITVHTRRSFTEVRLHQIRLRESKPWCGSHPGACVLEKKNRKHNLLEGLDWIELNDLCNSVLDELELEADVATPVCEIRRGRKRRICYDMFDNGAHGNEWIYEGSYQDYADYCGKIAPRSECPEGTPGEYHQDWSRVRAVA